MAPVFIDLTTWREQKDTNVVKRKYQAWFIGLLHLKETNTDETVLQSPIWPSRLMLQQYFVELIDSISKSFKKYSLAEAIDLAVPQLSQFEQACTHITRNNAKRTQ